MTTAIVLAVVLLLARGLVPSLNVARGTDESRPEPTARKMADALQQFLAGLSPELRQKASLPFDDPMRLVWHYYPRVAWQRTGVTLKELDGNQKKLFMAVVRAGTSDIGFQTAVNLMQLEAILRDIENTPFARKFRDPELFYLTVFGTPAATGRWMWKLEGHHLQLSYVIENGRIVSGTPFVVGANPGRVPSGPHRGLRILPQQEDLGRQLYTSLGPAARKQATIADQPPFDVETNADTVPRRLPDAGLSWADMTEPQQQLVESILLVYTGLQPAVVEERNIAAIRAAGMERVRFGWAGSAEPGKPHYYRLIGPTFVVEYCNAQNSGNHIHVVWRDYDNDFAEDFPPTSTNE